MTASAAGGSCHIRSLISIYFVVVVLRLLRKGQTDGRLGPRPIS
jgi:hypothetical protein